MAIELATGMYIYYAVLAAVVGACMASFLGCMAWRIVHGESVAKGRSHCDDCGHTLAVRDLVPIVSFLAAKGKCRYCGKKLSPMMLWGEILSALIFLATFVRFGMTLQALEGLCMASVLLACSFADLEGYIIPDRFLLAGLVLRLVFVFTSGNLVPELVKTLIGGVSVTVVLLIVVLVMEKVMKREAMGGGDLKLLAYTGCVLGWQKNVLCVLFACVLGIVFAVVTQKKRQDQEDAKVFPWGPSIGAAGWIVFLFGDAILEAYLGLF